MATQQEIADAMAIELGVDTNVTLVRVCHYGHEAVRMGWPAELCGFNRQDVDEEVAAFIRGMLRSEHIQTELGR